MGFGPPPSDGQAASPLGADDDFRPASAPPVDEAADEDPPPSDEDDEEDGDDASPLVDDGAEPVTAFELPFLESVE